MEIEDQTFFKKFSRLSLITARVIQEKSNWFVHYKRKRWILCIIFQILGHYFMDTWAVNACIYVCEGEKLGFG